jgi:hypothetical protein
MFGSIQIILFCATIFIISSIAIFLPNYYAYYYAYYKSSQEDKHNLINSFCNILNQTYQYKYSCVKKFLSMLM